MNESKWLACTDPSPMLEFLSGRAGDRKLRLFAIACCLPYWHLIRHPCSRRAVEVAEAYADGFATKQQLADVHGTADHVLRVLDRQGRRNQRIAAEAAMRCAELPVAVARVAERALGLAFLLEDDRRFQCALLRDIFGNPFRPASLSLSWLAWNDSTIPKLAQAIYDGRAFDRLPLLADALEDAGCTDADLLGHCRTPGEHVRGCWVVDLLLGKS